MTPTDAAHLTEAFLVAQLAEAVRVVMGAGGPAVRIAEPRVVRDAAEALRVEYEEGAAVCRACLVVVDVAAARSVVEGLPLCPGCYAERMEEAG